MRTGLIAIAIAGLLPASAFAADPPRAAISDEHRLSESEVQKILDAAATKREAAPLAEAPPPPRQVEGEMGVAIGTGGYREVFGTAVVPIGAEGIAIISFDRAESNRRYKRRR